jgi:hypothetical protein
MLRLPIWLTLGIAALVIIFGVYRIILSRRSDAQEAVAQKRKGLYGMARRTHLLIGIVYLLLGAGLTAASFGWNPFGNFFGPSTEQPSKDKMPSKSVPLDSLPPPKGAK